MRSIAGLMLKIPLYWSFRALGKPVLMPFNYTLSITYRCNSRCKTCNIWLIQKRIPREAELTLEEWSKVLKSLERSPFWITISGGEPFLREDLAEIVKMIDKYNKPKIINIATNGILWRIIPQRVEEILSNISDKTILVINFSLDGIGELHDWIRGVPGNYIFLKKAYEGVKRLKTKYHNLIVGIHTVISSWNVDAIPMIYHTVKKEFSPDQYIAEIAEERREMENFGSGIVPSMDKFAKIIDFLINQIEKDLKQNIWKGFAVITEAFRIEYYKFVRDLYLTGKQKLSSYAGYASAHISPIGDVWECAVYASFMGNLREYNYDFKKLWNSHRAWQVRKNVKRGHLCPLANECYSNMLLNPKFIVLVLARIVKFLL